MGIGPLSNTLQRIRRFAAIWRLSGNFELGVQAGRWRCQAVVLDFLRSGGRVSDEAVEYRNAQLPRSMFSGRDLGGLGYVTQLVEHGGTIGRQAGDVYRATLPSGLVFEASTAAFVDTLCMMVERFVSEEYGWLKAAGHVVIDVGANVGDSAIYFATSGAVCVYGYEPDAAAYDAALRNIALNDVANVTMTKAAVSGPRTTAGDSGIPFAEVLNLARSEHAGVPIICKIDCEGCEFEIFAPGSLQPEAVRDVSQIMIEYHWRSPETLSETLQEMGFQVETAAGPPGVGWIRAHRP
jgi:hypothetical protein